MDVLLRLWAIPLKREPEAPSVTHFSISLAMATQISALSTAIGDLQAKVRPGGGLLDQL